MSSKAAFEIEFKLLLDTILQKYHYDFHGYSKASLKRRLLIASQRFNYQSFGELRERILYDDSFFTTLISYLTVQVTDMFRDPSFFKNIRENVVPVLKTYPSLKVWVAGCSSGEELYSLAILFREEGLERRTIFYGTDINREALKKAELGVFPREQIAQFTKNHQLSGAPCSLSEYYTAGANSVVFDKTLRQQMVFSDHSLASDSVFAEVHLITCRNVLIYFDKALQNRAIKLFTDSLIRRGFLGLGSKETLKFSNYNDHYTEFTYDERLYQRKG